jgi:hypothetical protein
MEIEDGVTWFYGVGEDGVMAFADFGIENLTELIKMHKDNPALLERDRPERPARRPTPNAYAIDNRWRSGHPS